MNITLIEKNNICFDSVVKIAFDKKGKAFDSWTEEFFWYDGITIIKDNNSISLTLYEDGIIIFDREYIDGPGIRAYIDELIWSE